MPKAKAGSTSNQGKALTHGVSLVARKILNNVVVVTFVETVFGRHQEMQTTKQRKSGDG